MLAVVVSCLMQGRVFNVVALGKVNSCKLCS